MNTLPPPRTYPNCPLHDPASLVGMSISQCRPPASDTAASADPVPFWGQVDCESADRHKQFTSGGDPHTTSDGSPQPDGAFRRLSVVDGDDYYGERCELGKNDFRDGPTVLYGEGERAVTYMSIRLPDNFQLDRLLWQVVMQMKQTQPSADIGTPVIELDAYDGRWVVLHSTSNTIDPTYGSEVLWDAPAQKNVWTRFAFDVTYSQYADQGSIKVSVDLNANGSFDDSGEQSPRFKTYTLKREPDVPQPPFQSPAAGSSLPSHLRMGPYHDPSYACPQPSGCSVDIDNVQVVKP